MNDSIDKLTQKAPAGVERTGSIFESLPVIGDYLDKERRREADRRLRESIAVSLEGARKRLISIERMLLNKGKLTDLPYVDVAVNRLQTLVDRVRTAASGYAGFFDMEKIREPQLDRLHQFDERIAASVPEIAGKIDKMQQAIASGEDYSQSLIDLIKGLDDLGEHMDHRKEAMRAAEGQAASIPETTSIDTETPDDPSGDTSNNQ